MKYPLKEKYERLFGKIIPEGNFIDQQKEVQRLQNKILKSGNKSAIQMLKSYNKKGVSNFAKDVVKFNKTGNSHETIPTPIETLTMIIKKFNIQ